MSTIPIKRPAKNEFLVPELSLVLMIGASGSGKSTFARQQFKETEILSSDYFRALVSDDENDQSVTKEAFDVLHYAAAARLKLGRLTVIDATNARREDREKFLLLARKYHCMPVAIVLNMPKEICYQRNQNRSQRNLPEQLLRSQMGAVRRSLRKLKRDGFRHVHILNSVEEADDARIVRQKMWTDLKHEHGPFDIIGDIHGCWDETFLLLEKLGYQLTETDADGFDFGRGYQISHPDNRKPVLLGDLVDRGPGVVQVLRLAMSLVQSGTGICVPGNHDVKLVKKFKGKNVKIAFGLSESLEQLEKESEEFREKVAHFLDKLVSHFVLDDGKLVAAHAGMKEEYQGRGSSRTRSFALYGETTGETDEFGLPVRYNWASDYRGKACVVYGHTPVPVPQWLNRTINIDTGCVFGGYLTALRYPEKELMSVKAKKEYTPSVKPFTPGVKDTSQGESSLQQQHDHLLDVEDVSGKLLIQTRAGGNVTIREDYTAAALETMSRYAINPKWLIYLPPTMSPSETSQLDGFLEHPLEAFQYFAQAGVKQVICQEKHMGSRAVIIVCKDKEAALKRFGETSQQIGVCYTRTGRPFFNDPLMEHQLLVRLQDAVQKAGLWEELNTDWFCLDSEIMPWSVKAQELLRNQYAAVGSSARAALKEVGKSLEKTKARGMDVDGMLSNINERMQMADQFTQAYRNYCWPVESMDDIRVAPFHILAAEGQVFTNKNHLWHMETISKLCSPGPSIFQQTRFRIVDVTDEAQVKQAVQWWLEMTEKGGEGMVVKPIDFITLSHAKDSQSDLKIGKLVQPALKCRGQEYLRIIYGMDYTAAHNLNRLRKRGLSLKRSLAAREFTLGIEGLERFVRKEPLRRVHECAFAVLALESQPVDPRL